MFHSFFIMDWLTFQFYIVIWVLCTSEIKAEFSNPEMPHCVPGQPVPSPDKCNSCICYEGKTFCTKLPCPAPACENGETLPNPDPCNKCMCNNNKVACSDLICIPAPQCIEKKQYPSQNKCNVCMCLKGHIMCTTNTCTIEKKVVQETFAINETIVDDSREGALAAPLQPPSNLEYTIEDRIGLECDVNQPIYRPEDCNECYCFEGRLVCSDLICIRGSKCVEGQEIPKPDSCNFCKCVETHIVCTTHKCPDTVSKNSFGTESTSTQLEPFEQCKPGDAIPPPPPPNDCNTCTCLDNRVVCSQRECHEVDFVPEIKTRFITAEEEKNELGVSECVDGQELPKPDSCNYCICIEEHVLCTNHHCPDIISKNSFGSESISTQLEPFEQCKPGDAIPPPPPPNDCNTCTCLDNRVVCSQRECHEVDFVPEIKTRFITAEEEKNELGVSECVDGQELPKPDSCNYCICIEEHVLCTNHKCPVRTSKNSFEKESTSTQLEPFEQCKPGDAIPPPPPPNDCNTCTCLDNRVVCSQRECHEVDFVPEIKTRFITAEEEKNEHSSKLKEFDKQLSVEPIVDMLLKSHDKRPSKLVRTHAYNGFQQEIKVHSGQLSKDTARLLKALASSLHSPALADIGDKLLYEKTHQFISNNGDTINLSTKNSFDLQEIPVTQFSKIITSGSQGNETILVIPELLSKQSHVTITPIMTHHETIWNTVASPPPIVSKNTYEIYSHGSKAKNLPENQDGSSILTIEKHEIVSNSNKFDHSGQEHAMTLPRLMVTTPTGNSHSENLAFQISPNPTNGNNGRPYTHHNDQYEALQYKTRAKYTDSSIRPTSDYTLMTSSYKQSPEYKIYKIAPKNPHATSIAIQLNQNSINGNSNGKPNQVLSRLTEPNVVPVTTYTLLTSRYKPRQDKDSYYNAHQLDTNISKMTVHKMQMNPEVNRYVSNVNTSPQPMYFPNNQHRPRDLSNDPDIQFKQTNKWISSNQNVQSSRGEQVLLNNRYKKTTKFPPNSPQIHLNEIKNVNDDEKNPYLPHYTTDINPSPRLTQPEVTYTITHTTSPKSHPIYHDTVNHIRLPLPKESRHYDQSQYGKHSTITYLSELDPVLNGKLQVRHDSYKATYVPNKQTIVKNNMPVVVQIIKGTYDNEPKLNHHSPDDAQEFIDHYQQNNVSPAMHVDHKYNPPSPMNKLRVDKHNVPPRSHQFTPDLTRSEINPLTASYPNVVGQPPSPAQSQMKFPPTQLETAHLNPLPTNLVPGGVPLENNSQKRFKIKPLRFVRPVKKPHSTPSRHFKNPYLPISVDHNPNNNFLNSDNANPNPLHHNRLPNNLPYQNLPVSPNGEDSPLKHHYRLHHSGNNPHVGHKNPSNFNPNQPQSIQKPQPHFGTPYKHHEPRYGVTPQSVGFPSRANTVPHNHIPDRNINQPLHSQPSPEDIPRGPGVVNSHSSPAPVVGPLTLPEGPSIPKGFINQPPKYNPKLYPPRINPNQYTNYQPRPHQNPGLNPLNANKNPNIYTDSQPHQRPHPQEAIHNNENQNKYPIPHFESPLPQQSQIEPGLLDHHKTYDDYQYHSNSSEYLPPSLESPGHYPPKAQIPPISNQPTSGISGNPAPDFAYQYLPPPQAFESSRDPHELQSVDSYPNKNQPLELTKDQQTSENIDRNEPFDVEVAKHTLDNLHTPPQIPFEPYPNENGLEFTDGGKNPNSKEYNDQSPHLQPIQENPQTNLDDFGSNDDYFLPEHNSPQNTFERPHKENSLDIFDDTSEGSNYPPSSIEDITHSNNLSEQPHSNTSPTKTPDFNVRGPDTGSEYKSESTKGTTYTKRPISETEIPYDFDDPGSGGAYASNSAEDQNKSPWKPQISTTISPRNSWSPKEVDKIHKSGNASTPELNHDHKELKDNRAGIWNPIELDNNMLDLNPNVLANMLSVANDTKKLDKVYPSLILLIKNLTKLEHNSSDFVDSDLDQVDFLPVLLSILIKYQNEINKLKHKQYNSNNSIFKLMKEITANKYKPEDEIDVQTIYDMLSKLPTLNINITNTKVTDDDVEEYLLKLIQNIQEKALITTTHPGNEKITITTKFKTSQPADSHSKYQDLLNVLQEFQEGDPWDLLALVNSLTVDNVSQGDDESIQSRFSNPKPPQYMFKHKLKDQKEECGDGTVWFKNCHECSCQSGHAYCSKVPDCIVRPVGEPMMCKPYTQFNMSACYICECNADGIPDCDGSPCVGQSPTMNEEIHKGKEFFDEKKTKKIIEYYNTHKKLPKYCSDLRLLYPTCKPRSSWISDCHDCTCNDKGQRECTKIEECEMPNVHSYGEPSKCKPNSKFYPKSSGMPCKECSCDDNGEPHCPTNDHRK